MPDVGRPRVFLTFEDDGCVFVHESAEAASVAIEPLDVEDRVRAAFDDRGQRYMVEWIEPNWPGRALFGFHARVNGPYRFVPCGTRDVPRLLEMLDQTQHVFPVGSAEAVRTLRANLVAEGPGGE